MTTRTVLDIQSDGSVPGLTVIGFHGHMATDETPAKLGPVYSNAGCLTRIVEVGPTQWTPNGKVRIESYPPPLPDDGPLPGQGTRVHPWEARHGNVMMAVGPEERRFIDRLRQYARKRGIERVGQFVQWFAGDAIRSDDLACERQGGIALWYCTEPEGFSLLECVHHVVKTEFFRAVRSNSPSQIEDMAWWLSRAAISDQDIYLAGAALRRVASPAWDVLIREALHLADKKQWQTGLDEAEWHLNNPPPVPDLVMDAPPRGDYLSRNAVRELFKAA